MSDSTQEAAGPKGQVLLIVDDSITVRTAIRKALEPTRLFARYVEARNGNEALELLGQHPVDVIVCDLVMPDLDGFALLQIIKANPRTADIPVLMLTGQESVEKKVAGLELGASDYVTKPFAKDELIARVRVHLKVKLLQDRLREASVTDYLTKRFNRRHFMEVFYHEFERARRHGHPLSLIILDIDHFKRINDTCGHVKGDRVLIDVAAVISANVRGEDTVARYGGEEFVILLPHIGEEGALSAAEKVRAAIAAYPFPEIEAAPVTVSLGLVTFHGNQPGTASIDSVLMLADSALYASKSAGRNCVSVVRMPH
jgi:two-component system, cell cycle response regulator